jgi:hypothetical protein
MTTSLRDIAEFRRDLLNCVFLHRSLLMFRGCWRGSSAGFRELTRQRPGIEARDFRSKDIMASANIDGLQEFFLPKSPYSHRRQSGLLNKFIERHRWF